jgi:hypothetical protein
MFLLLLPFNSKLRFFADDSIIYKEITCQDDYKKLQFDLDAAARWEADWLMAFHPDKCTVLTITQKKTVLNIASSSS